MAKSLVSQLPVKGCICSENVSITTLTALRTPDTKFNLSITSFNLSTPDILNTGSIIPTCMK